MAPLRYGLRATPQGAEGEARPREFDSFGAPRHEVLSASPDAAQDGEGAAGGPIKVWSDGTPEEWARAAGKRENAADETAARIGRGQTAATDMSAAAFVDDAAEMSPTMPRRPTAPRGPSDTTTTTTTVTTPDRDRSVPNDQSQPPLCPRDGHGLETERRSDLTTASACATMILARSVMARRRPCRCRSTASPAAGVAASPRLRMLLLQLLAAMLLMSPPSAQLRPMSVAGLTHKGKTGGGGGTSSMKGTGFTTKRLDVEDIHNTSGSNSSSGGGGGGSTSSGVGSSSSSSGSSSSSSSNSRNNGSVSSVAGAGPSAPQAGSSTAAAAGNGKARPQGSGAPTPPPTCDIFTGRWVRDFARRPAYTLKDCPQLYSIARTTYCINKKKPRNPSWMFWSWESTSCQRKPRFNATDFLEFVRNKTLAFIGDSLLTADFFPSLLCQISAAGHNLRRRNNAHWNKRGGMWTIDSYNVSLITVFSPFLVAYKTDPQLLRQLRARNPEPSKDGSGGDRAISLRKPDSAWSFDLSRFDIAVFQSAAHWNPSTKWRGLIYTDGLWRRLEKQPTVEEAYARAMSLVINLFTGNTSSANSSSNGATKLPVPYLLSPPPRIDNCRNITQPSTPAQARQALMNGGGQVGRYGTQSGLVKGTPFRHVDITHLSLFRGDALLSSGQTSGRDCLHSCLPGLPDSWVDLFYEVVKNDPALQPTAAATAPGTGSGSSGGGGGSGGSATSQGGRPGIGGTATRPFVPAIDFDYPSIVW